MKAISCELQLTGCSTRADKSLSLRFSSPELEPSQKVAFMELQGANLKVIIQPMDSSPEELVTVDREIQTKTPSQRLRSILFVAFQQQAQEKSFDLFYNNRMAQICDAEKAKLEPSAF
jgi:hypothetical protein